MRLIDDDKSLLRIFQLGSLVLACGFGVDYMLDPPRSAMYVFERLLGSALPWWGTAFLTLGIMGLLGEVWIGNRTSGNCRCRLSCFAHSWLFAMYSGIAAGSFMEMLVSGHLYGARMVGGMIMLAIGHFAFARRRRHAT